MEIVLICVVAFLASGLTLFSGFGLGTLLLPVFGLFFPLPLAIAMTALVHLLNNLFKLYLFRGAIRTDILWRFGLPAVAGALAGAFLLRSLGQSESLLSYTWGTRQYHITALKLSIGLLMIIFALFELLPRWKNWSVAPSLLPVGGLLSGFFGGLSGHQGALRSAFLIRLKLSKEAFIATGVASACLIDVSRLSLYANMMRSSLDAIPVSWVLLPTFCAFAGAWGGNRLLKKITVQTLHFVVALFIVGFGLLLMAGIV